MPPLPEYQRLALLDHVATASSEMPDEDDKALRNARASQESIDLNVLMDKFLSKSHFFDLGALDLQKIRVRLEENISNA
jgi:hypothetical protein